MNKGNAGTARIFAAVLGGMLIAACVGCAGHAAGGGADPITASTPAAPSPTPTPSVIAAPTAAFGGDCNAIIDVPKVSAMLGSPLVRYAGRQSERTQSVVILGGLTCVWKSATGADMTLDVVPVASLSDVEVAGPQPYCYGGPEKGSQCSFVTQAAGYWFDGVVHASDGGSSWARDAIMAVRADFAARAADHPAAAVVRPSGTWPSQTCQELGSRVDTQAALGAAYTADQVGMPGEVPPVMTAAWHAAGDLACGWTAPNNGGAFETELLPAAGWMIDDLAAVQGAQPVAVTGAMKSVEVPNGGGTRTIYSTDGVNLSWLIAPAQLDEARALAFASAVFRAAG